MQLFRQGTSLVALGIIAALLGGCAFPGSAGSHQPSAYSELQIPEEPENSEHGYLTEDDRIPRLTSCTQWREFWIWTGPAVSFVVAAKFLSDKDLQVSTQIYLKNRHLDTDKDGVICNEFKSASPLPVSKNANLIENSVDLKKCMLSGDGLGVGFPRPKGYLPVKKDISAVMLFVEFPGYKITENIETEAKSYYESFQRFMEIQSLGQQRWNFTVPNQIFKINRNPKKYGADFSSPNFGNPRFTLYLQDAVKAADPYVDFSKFDAVYVIPPKAIGSVISFGPSFPKLPKGNVVSDEGSIRSAATAGNDSRLGNNSEAWAWLAHETGHLYGLSHPLNEKGRYDEFGRELSPDNRTELWDLMSWLRSPSPQLWGWSRFWLGWLGSSEVFCLNPSKLEEGVELNLAFSDVETQPGKIQLGVLRLSKTKALVLEARKPTKTPFNGTGRLLVYLVDVTKGDNEGQIQIVRANENRFEGFLDGSLKVGESVLKDNIRVEATAEIQNGLSLKISNK